MLDKLKRNKNILTLGLMVFISCIIQVLTIMKSSIVAGYFGTSDEMDAYNLAYNIVTFIYSFGAAGISTIVIPEYVKKKNKKEVDSFLTVVFGVLLTVSLAIILFRNLLIGSISNRDSTFIQISGNILIVLFGAHVFSIVTNVTGAFFQCAEKYNIPKIINLISQILVVLILAVFRDITIYDYTLIISCGIVFNFIIDAVIAVKVGWRYRPSVLFNDTTKGLLKLFIPVVFSTGIYRVSLLVDTAISSRLDSGSITILSYSNQISSMVNTLIIGNLLIYFYPQIVKNIKENKKQQSFWDQTIFFHATICLVILGFAAIGQEGISLLFEHGNFNHNATVTVFQCSLIYIFGQQSNVIRDLIYRYFYALGDTSTAAKNSVLVATVNIVISIVLSIPFGIYGIVIGTIIASLVSLTVITIIFKKKIGFENSFSSILKTYIKTEIIMIVSALIIAISKKAFAIDSNIVSILIFGIESVAIYSILTYIFNRRVIKTFRNL